MVQVLPEFIPRCPYCKSTNISYCWESYCHVCEDCGRYEDEDWPDEEE